MKMALRKTLRRFVLSSWIKYSSAFYSGAVFSSVMTNYGQSYKEDKTVALTLKHFVNNKKDSKGLFVEKFRKL